MKRSRSLVVKVRMRIGWHQSARGCWSLSLGESGCRVRIVQRRPDDLFYRVTWVPGQGPQWASLRTKNRAEAQHRAEALLRALIEEGGPRERRPLTLGELWERYQQEAIGYRENTQTTREGKQVQARHLLGFFGANKRLEDLCPNDVARYTQARRSSKGVAVDRVVRRRTTHADLVFLRTLLNWATSVKVDGEWLLEENPLRGMKFPMSPIPGARSRPSIDLRRFDRPSDSSRLTLPQSGSVTSGLGWSWH
jgi:hypothetical protein